MIVKKIEILYNENIKETQNILNESVLNVDCVEIGLRPFQLCNLVEVNVSNITDQTDLNNRIKVVSFIATLQASYTDFHYLRTIWKKNTEKDALLGISLTGIASRTLDSLNLEEATNIAIQENERVSKLIGINKAARLTCVKPSGCMILETLIKTSKGILSFEQIFELNGYSNVWNKYTEKLFLPVTEKILVKDLNDDWKEITNLYINGIEDTYDIEFEDGKLFSCTENHMFLTKNGGWVRADELQNDDEIIQY